MKPPSFPGLVPLAKGLSLDSVFCSPVKKLLRVLECRIAFFDTRLFQRFNPIRGHVTAGPAAFRVAGGTEVGIVRFVVAELNVEQKLLRLGDG